MSAEAVTDQIMTNTTTRRLHDRAESMIVQRVQLRQRQRASRLRIALLRAFVLRWRRKMSLPSKVAYVWACRAADVPVCRTTFASTRSRVNGIACMSSDGVRVFVDPKSFIYLHGMVLDYEESLMRQGFHFVNPNSTKSCGCGSSFSS